jgi:hypothetical protein
MSQPKPWQPRIDPQSELNPFSNGASDRDALLETPQIEDAEEDSAPLEGSHDLSDEDSLIDVIAEQSRPKPPKP